MAETLDVIKDGIMNAYVEKTGKNKDELAKLMDEETWYTGEKAVENGFADRTYGGNEMPVMNSMNMIVNSISHDLSKFKNLPKVQQPTNQPPEKTAIENNKPSEKGDHEMEIKNAADLKASNSAIYDEILNQGKQEGQNAEKSRQAAIDEIANNIDGDFVAKAKAEGWTAEQLALNAMKEGKFKNQMVVKNLEDDAQTANKVDGDAPADQDQDKDKEGLMLNSIADIAAKTLKRG
jgi:hypothetical protein